MFKHYVKVAIRLIKRSFLFSAINILGFILGMAAAFLIYLWIADEMTFEDQFTYRDRIYRTVVVSRGVDGKLEESPNTVVPLARSLRENFPQIENATTVSPSSSNTRSLQYKDKRLEGFGISADSCFFDVFNFEVIEGSIDGFKYGRDQVVLTEETARKLFGNESAAGKQVLDQWLHLYKNYYTVAAVIKAPGKTHIQFDIVWQMGEHSLHTWGNRWDIFTYVQFKKNYRISGKERNALSRHLADRSGTNDMIYFQPITDIHLKTRFYDPLVKNHGSMQQIYLFAGLAILIVFMGAFNYMTLSTARASLRYKEIAVRKVTGAKRRALITQFLSESVMQALISLILALALTELLLPLFNQMTGKEISLAVNQVSIIYILLGIFGVGCLAGSYPAFYLSAINPLLVFKGGKKTGRKGGFVEGLVCVQFTIAISLLLCTFTVFKQLNYLQNKDLGFEKESIVSVRSSLWYKNDDFKQEVLRNPNVISVSQGLDISDYMREHDPISLGFERDGQMVEWYNDEGTVDSMSMIPVWADGEFAETFELELIRGETYKTDFEAYWRSGYEFPCLINETAWRRMKVDDPIGIKLHNAVWHGFTSAKVVGVVKDFNFQPLKEELKPMFMAYSPENITWTHFRISAENRQETLLFLKKTYEEHQPGKVFTYRFLTDALQANYARENQQGQMFLIFTVLAIVIALMGVLGMVVLSTERRTKEIGIRKVIGARSKRIVKMFCLDYMKWIGIAFAIACPVSYLFMDRWLSNFVYRTSLSWWLFPMAGLIVWLITMATVITQINRTASRNPVESLRYE